MRNLAILANVSLSAFANTNAGCKLYVCTTPQSIGINQAAFEALTYVLIGGVGMVGETGISTNLLTYDTWDTDVDQKAKGRSDGGSPDVEVARDPANAGQDAMRAAALTNLNYAFKLERNDKPNSNVGSKPTTIYNLGLVVGPKRPNGRNEDFDLEIFSLGLQQREIVVDPVTV